MQISKNKLYNLINAFVIALLKRTICNKETKREVENEKSQSRDKKAITADSAPDPIFSLLCCLCTVHCVAQYNVKYK